MIQTCCYKGIVIAELCECYCLGSFQRHLGNVFKEYVNRGGRLAFPTCDGVDLIDVLKTLFDVQWEPTEFTKSYYSIPAGRADFVDQTFPLIQTQPNKKMASEVNFFLGGITCKNVPANEQCFVNTVKKSESEIDDPAQIRMSSVAVHQFCEGSIAFFGDIDGTPMICDLVAAYCMA